MRVVLGALIWCVCLAMLGIPILVLLLVKLLVTAITCRRSANTHQEVKLATLKGNAGGAGNPQWKIPYNIGFCLKVKAPYLVKDFPENCCGQLKQIIEGPTHLGVMKGLPRDQNPFHCIFPVSSPERKQEWMYCFTSFPLDDLKSLRKLNGNIRIASVVFTLLVGALRRFLVEVEHIKEDELPLEVMMGNSLPWPRHPAMNENIRGPDRLQNHWTDGFYKFPLRESDALIRMQKIEKEYVSFFDNGVNKFLKRTLVPMFKLLPVQIAASMSTPSNATDMGAVMNLVVGIGADKYNLLGCPVERIHPLLGIPDNMPYVPLHCFTFSHSGRMEVVLGANPQSIFQNKERLDIISQKLMHDELKHILSVTNINVLVQ